MKPRGNKVLKVHVLKKMNSRDEESQRIGKGNVGVDAAVEKVEIEAENRVQIVELLLEPLGNISARKREREMRTDLGFQCRQRNRALRFLFRFLGFQPGICQFTI